MQKNTSVDYHSILQSPSVPPGQGQWINALQGSFLGSLEISFWGPSASAPCCGTFPGQSLTLSGSLHTLSGGITLFLQMAQALFPSELSIANTWEAYVNLCPSILSKRRTVSMQTSSLCHQWLLWPASCSHFDSFRYRQITSRLCPSITRVYLSSSLGPETHLMRVRMQTASHALPTFHWEENRNATAHQVVF